MEITPEVLGPVQIERDINRGFLMLRVYGTIIAIRKIMEAVGYTEAAHQEGWRLLLKLVGHKPPGNSDINVISVEHESAIQELEAWLAAHYMRALIALEHLHAEQAEYIFENLEIKKGYLALVIVNEMVDRILRLKEGTDAKRAETREEDRAAVATLEERNIISDEIITRLKELITKIRDLDDSNLEKYGFMSDEEYQQTAREFHAWVTDWRETSRISIKKRSYLIKLGLAQRRSRKTKA